MLNLTAETMDEAADEIMRKALTLGTDHEEKGAFDDLEGKKTKNEDPLGILK